jgi:hypothetical protein
MSTAPRTLADDEPLEDVEADLLHILLALYACRLTTQLAPPIAQLLSVDLEAIRAQETQLTRAVDAETAKVPFADDDLDVLLDQAEELLITELGTAEAKAMLARLLKNRPPSEVRRPVLQDQLETQREWEAILKPTGKQNLADYGGRVTKAVKYADEQVLAPQASAQTALDAFMKGPRANFIAACNAARGVVFGKLVEIAEDPKSGPLPKDFIDRFFLRDTSRRVMRLGDLDKMITRLTTKLANLQERRKELAASQETAAKQKLQRQIDARRNKLAGRRKSIANEEAELAAMEAELAKKQGQ